MIREAYQDLLQWKARPNRKPLIIQGARQVGKTWLMKTFGSTEYAQLAYFNFEQSTMLYQIFQQGFDVRRIITSLEIALGKSIQSENTLLVFDEIQACPEAITALKYFQENAPEYHIVAAGSLLGVAIHKGVSFPVGKVDFLSLSPLNFHEYLLAMKADSLLYAIQANDPKILKPFGDQLGQHVRQYCFLGGMPEVIFQFATNNDFFQVREIQ
jgi:predicted AAA+ superfamily ATPase